MTMPLVGYDGEDISRAESLVFSLSSARAEGRIQL